MTIIKMRPTFDPNRLSWDSYYQSQAKQNGHGMQLFHGVPYQRGSGIGSIFKGLFRMILPLASRAGKTLGKEALSTGLNIAGDALGGKNIGMATKRRVRKGARKIVKKAKTALRQSGNGISRKRKRKTTSQGGKRRKRRKTTTVRKTVVKRKRVTRKKKVNFSRDIFG